MGDDDIYGVFIKPKSTLSLHRFDEEKHGKQEKTYREMFMALSSESDNDDDDDDSDNESKNCFFFFDKSICD